MEVCSFCYAWRPNLYAIMRIGLNEITIYQVSEQLNYGTAKWTNRSASRRPTVHVSHVRGRRQLTPARLVTISASSETYRVMGQSKFQNDIRQVQAFDDVEYNAAETLVNRNDITPSEWICSAFAECIQCWIEQKLPALCMFPSQCMHASMKGYGEISYEFIMPVTRSRKVRRCL